MKKIILVFLLLSAFSSQLKAQGISTDGKDFYLGFMYPSFNRVIPAFSAGFFRIYAIISSYQDNTAYISYFNEDGTETAAQPYKIQARKSIQVPLSVLNLRMTDPGDLIKEYKSLHITSKKPITVQFFSTGASSCGMYTAIPTTLLGKKHVIASYNDNPEGFGAMLGGRGPLEIDKACGYFQVIGTQNGTKVTITPTSTTQGGKHIGVTNGPGATGAPTPYTISLNRGQCYMVKSHCNSSANDITGSIVESDKPVAVISGHENAGIGTVGNRSLEARDFMVEQMIPVEHWDNTGYVSIPFVDSDPYVGSGSGHGEHYRAIVYDSTENINVAMARAGMTTVGIDVARYLPGTKFDIEEPVDFSTGTKPFMVYQIDQANHSQKQPYPRPSMSQIIPISRWKNAYLWYVPSNVDERLQAYYVNIIAPKNKFDSIYVSKNGAKDVLIASAGLSPQGVYQNIPGHPDLMGKRFKVVPGSYYARANFPFIIYSFGNRAIDADGDLGDFDNDDNFFSYASHLGYQFGTVDTTFSITVDTLCTGWRICATDLKPGGGIHSASLADDPYGDMFVFDPKVRGPYQYYNSSFSPTVDPNGTRQILFQDTGSSSCFEVSIDNIGKDGYAPIIVSTESGSWKMVELYFKKAAVSYQPNPDTVTNLGLQYILDRKDSTFKFINNVTSQKPYIIEDIDLIKNNPAFVILSYSPAKPFPFSLSPGDTLSIKVRFTYNDTGYFSDSLKMKANCFSNYWPIEGTVGSGIIVTSDHDFGNVIVGDTRCIDTLQIKNIGSLPFTLTRDFLLQDAVNFSVDPDRVRVGNRDESLPIVLQPGQFVRARVCYSPKDEGADSTALIWKTDIPSPYTLSLKTFSVLRGRGIKPGVNWDVDTGYMRADSSQTRFMRRWLVNKSTAPISVDSIFLQGVDASEFKIAALQNPLEIAVDVDDSVWIDISVIPDLTKPANYLRRAQVIATNTFDKSEADTLHLVAGFNVLKVPQELQLEELRIHPNPTLGEDITARFALTEPKKLRFAVYDMLGREVLTVPSSYFAKGKQSVMLPVSKLGEGGYILRVSDGVLTRSISFRVIK